jgi:hypothetical protein
MLHISAKNLTSETPSHESGCTLSVTECGPYAYFEHQVTVTVTESRSRSDRHNIYVGKQYDQNEGRNDDATDDIYDGH